ncbi:MAG TPA: HAD family phosphatase [Rhodocyclaceae bacterium]|nr:HAD family phosphatase [Rhodocyclaceae bacterium]
MRLTLSRPGAVIFDMDGLLLDNERIVLRLFAQAAAALDLKWREDVGLQMVGHSREDSDKIIATAFGANYPVARLREHYDALYEVAIVSGNIPVKPYVHELIARLEALRIRCAVATSSHRMRATAKLTRTNLLSHFQVLACGDEVLRGKPSPDIFELAAERLGVQASHCLVLEDSNVGVRGAVAASMKVVMVPDFQQPDADIRLLGVPRVESLKDVLAALTY